MKEKERKLLEILFQLFVDNLLLDRELIDPQGRFNHRRLEALSKKLGLPNAQSLYFAILMCCGRISKIPLSQKLDSHEEKEVWVAAVKTIIKGNSEAALSCYQKKVKSLQKNVKTKGLNVSQKELSDLIRPIYLEAVSEVII